MRIWRSQTEFDLPASVLALGTFDGLHAGHRALIERAMELSREINCACVVCTFDRHPLSVLSPGNAPRQLMRLDEKLAVLEKMGVDGVAWPSVVSRVVAAALILRKCYQKGNAITVPKTTRLDAKMIKRILGIGIPSAFENSLFEAGRILVVSMISTFGTVQIAANAVANNLDGMGVIPGKALSLAMITVVGRCVGAGDSEQAVYYTRKLSLWSYIAMGLSNGAILLFLHKLIGIYALSGETMVLSETLVRIHAGFAILLWTLSFVLPNALRAANDVKFTMLVSILSMAVWRLGFSYLLCVRMGWGAVGVWIAMIIDWMCRVTCFVIRFRSGVWKNKYHA